MNHASIIAGCRNGERQAQKILFEAYSKGMHSVCRRYVKDEHDAEELLLNGFTKFFTTLDGFEYRDDKSVGGWLKRIMVNECLMFLRREKRITFAPEETAGEVQLNEDVLERLNASAILKLIGYLPDGYRLVFNLYVIEGYDHREIAALLNISEGTSRSQLNRAKTSLQKLLLENGIMYEER